MLLRKPANTITTTTATVRKSGGNKKGGAKANGNNCNNKDGRWAEQLLNPCAAAITGGVLHFDRSLLRPRPARPGHASEQRRARGYGNDLQND